MKKFELTPPWLTYYHELEILFGEDPDIMVKYNDDDLTVKLYVKGEEKADALSKLLPDHKDFGNVKLSIQVIPANLEAEKEIGLFQRAFDGNPVFHYSKGIEGVFSNDIYYVVFQNKVVQFYNDALNDVNGNKTTLYENIARDIFGEQPGIYFCTDTPDGVGSDAWP